MVIDVSFSKLISPKINQGLTESSESFDKEVQDFVDFMQPGGETKRHAFCGHWRANSSVFRQLLWCCCFFSMLSLNKKANVFLCCQVVSVAAK